MVVIIAAIIIMLVVLGVVAFGLTLRDSENWLVRKFTGHAPVKVDEEELELLEHDRAGDT